MENLTREIEQLFRAEGVHAKVHMAQLGDDLNSPAQQAAKSDAEIIVAGGGDGTLNSVASAVVGTNKVFGVLPVGTLNHFAKDMQIHHELDKAVRTTAHGRTSEVAAGEFSVRS